MIRYRKEIHPSDFKHVADDPPPTPGELLGERSPGGPQVIRREMPSFLVDYEGVSGENNQRTFSSLAEAEDFIAETRRMGLGAILHAED